MEDRVSVTVDEEVTSTKEEVEVEEGAAASGDDATSGAVDVTATSSEVLAMSPVDVTSVVVLSINRDVVAGTSAIPVA